ncbi:MAG TPA: translation initiation factor IF-3 [Candidatus Marinimicrobia bacterium]|nr:translation initiation factor IF-3 [Candidatus Neomarinimicrobiota bacterium]HIN19561.1 translation initiation factor IF-3 [Candidatus Neomarinimicrobiota bacterium]HIO40165.1 translation initiation factor IF-3 [Candidatus Neomarinimicrobiota bacterium]
MAKDKNEPRINEDIRVPRVRLIDEGGNQAGVVTIKDALYKAEQAGLDLVEIAQKVDPPVCKILDFGKYRYEIQKQKKINKKKQHVVQVKEIRIRPNTGDHDLLTKLNKAQKFIASGAKLKVTVMFRGREMSRKEAGIALLKRVTDILEDVAKIDKAASMEGRRMSIILSPR